ncbi:MAG: uncharacterized protein QOG41_812 [Thermoleophilaceae bacterium]|jgi:uncharacterized membrane protein YedE/YeeE|nr:uncharacterized protein [Thermoleophilaceae bacterium]MEA2388039.1 uncharacterized protein [Thermoleophilaceae bacterium]
MTRVRVASVLLGAGFGFLLSWGQFIDPDRIRDMLLLRDGYMWLMFATAVAVAFTGLRLMRRGRVRSLLTGQPVTWTTARPERRHVVGAAIFGVGWAVSDVCPGPVAAQIGQGIAWSLPLLAGIGLGVLIHLREQEAPAERTAGRRAEGRAPGTALPASNPD